MTCTEYRAAFDQLVDEGRTEALQNEALEEHARTCDACAEYGALVRAMDLELRSTALPEPGEEFLAQLAAIPERSADAPMPEVSGWMREAFIAATVIVPCAAAAAIAAYLPVSIQQAIQVVFSTAGAAALMLAFLKPRFVAS